LWDLIAPVARLEARIIEIIIEISIPQTVVITYEVYLPEKEYL
jgi:hypothetical protein